MIVREQKILLLVPVLTGTLAFLALAADWPTWRADSSRAAQITMPLPKELKLRWVRELEEPEAAWPATQHKLQFDCSYEPIVAGKRLYLGSMMADYVAAFDTASGELIWRTCLGGPVRFAPLYWREQLYVASDDGLLYCLDAATGAIKWVKQGSPDRRLVLGNFRLTSAWPIRGAPVLEECADGGATIYYAAGIWPFMGIFIHAIDATNGELIWRNGGSGSTYVIQQHNSPAFAGVAPQGYLALQDGMLMMPGGRTVPAGFDAATGAMRYFEVSSRGYGKDAGGYDVSVMPTSFFNHGCLYDLKSGGPLLNLNSTKVVQGGSAVRVGEHFVTVDGQTLCLYSTTLETVAKKSRDRKGEETVTEVKSLAKPLISADVGWPIRRAWLRAGSEIYFSGKGGEVAAVSLDGGETPPLTWQSKVEGKVFTMIAGDNKLFVVTREGRLYCFGAEPSGGVVRHTLPQRLPPEALTLPGPRGYALVFGLEDNGVELVTQLAQEYHVVALDPDVGRITAMRQELVEHGIYGRRAHLLPYVPGSLTLPPYLAARIECFGRMLTTPSNACEVARLAWEALRPYGGEAHFRCARLAPEPPRAWHEIFKRGDSTARSAQAASYMAAWQALGGALSALEGAGGEVKIDPSSGVAQLTRPGALPGSSTWTHENADAGNTVVSRDKLVKPPLGMLWYGGLANDDILPRHGHGPMPQIVGGRLYIEGPDMLRSVDVYTGRLYWQREFKDLGKFYDNTSHQPGANEIGSNYVSMPDGIYVVHEGRCLRLDPATGETIKEFILPPLGDEQKPQWGYVGVWQDYLMAGASPLLIKDAGKDALPTVTTNALYASSSKWLVVFNRYSGAKLWEREAAQVFRHNAIVAGAGKLFCIDSVSAPNLALLKRRGLEPEQPAQLLAMDISNGKLLWQSDEKVRGTWLGYDETRDFLLEGGSPGSDRARDEITRHLAFYRGSDGKLLWRVTPRYIGRPMLHNKAIYTDRGTAYSLTTGEPIEHIGHLTGESGTWSFTRNYGCNTPIAGQHLLLFRSAAAGYYDLVADAGTGNFGGFKSGCTSNLIPADGVLNVPDYTRTCTCSYQNQCSLALVPMADVESWTFQAYDKIEAPLKRVGLNFGAPGDWLAPNGTLWLDTPSVGGKGPNLNVRIRGEVSYYRDHSLYMFGEARQVTASGIEGNFNVKIPLNNAKRQNYTVRFYFAEPQWQCGAGERAFDLYMQGKRVMRAFDTIAETKQPHRGVIKEFTEVGISDALRFELRARKSAKLLPLLCGIELVRE